MLVRWLVGRSVCPISGLICIIAPAQRHAADATVYTFLFLVFNLYRFVPNMRLLANMPRMFLADFVL